MLRLLLVDDDPLSRKLATVRLGPYGFDVQTAGNGREALDIIDAGYRPDVVLLDLMMPVMNGAAFYRELRSRPPTRQVPVVGLTAGDVVAEFECVVKPPNWTVLAARLGVLGRPRNGRRRRILIGILAALLAALVEKLLEKYGS